MRFAFLLPAALLAMGCGVPEVTFTPGGAHDAGKDAGMPVDGGDAGQAEAGDDAPADSAPDAPASDYCKDDAGAPGGFKCCMGVTGVVCGSNMCGQTACTQCATITCSWPNVCCASMGNVGTCKPAGSC